MSDSISAIGGPAAASATPPASTPQNSMGEDAFMQLLVIQLEHQDPTAPKDDSQLLAQLAQFSSLEKLTSIDQTLSQLTGLFSGAATSSDSSSSSSSTPTSSQKVSA